MGADATAARNGILGFGSDMLGITSGISVGGSAADSITVNGVSIGPYSGPGAPSPDVGGALKDPFPSIGPARDTYFFGQFAAEKMALDLADVAIATKTVPHDPPLKFLKFCFYR